MYGFYQQPYGEQLIRVTGLDGAKAYQMSPNSAVALFDGAEDIFYLKSTDGAGFPTIRVFRFEEVTATPAAAMITIMAAAIITTMAAAMITAATTAAGVSTTAATIMATIGAATDKPCQGKE